MAFGNNVRKSVQALDGLFNTPSMNRAAFRAGTLGRHGAGGVALDELDDVIRSGRRRMGGATVGLGLISASRQRGRSSGTRGLQPRSSAPTPMPPF